MNILNDIITNLKQDYSDIKIINKLDNANCNLVYLLEIDNNKYVLKIALNSNRKNELKKEYEIMNNIKGYINVPKMYKYIEKEDYSYILMGYIDGINLIDLLKEDKNKEQIIFDLGKLLKRINNFKIDDTKEPLYYLNIELDNAYNNMSNNLLDKEEFVINDKEIDSKKLLNKLKYNIPNNINTNFLHGDFRPKNIIYKNNKYYVIDFGLSHIGDFYYDLAIILYYFNGSERKMFLDGYGLDRIDVSKLQYYDYLSKYLNV
ncbi:MAG: phosphotransferase [Bacilli bacterium]